MAFIIRCRIIEIAYGSLAYLQRFIPALTSPGFDWRVLVVGGRAVTAMRRVSSDWIHNVAQGARCEPARTDDRARSRWPKAPLWRWAWITRAWTSCRFQARHPGDRSQRRRRLAGVAAVTGFDIAAASSTTCSIASSRAPGRRAVDDAAAGMNAPVTELRQRATDRARACFLRACELDVAVRKPGNVSVGLRKGTA